MKAHPTGQVTHGLSSGAAPESSASGDVKMVSWLETQDVEARAESVRTDRS